MKNIEASLKAFCMLSCVDGSSKSANTINPNMQNPATAIFTVFLNANFSFDGVVAIGVCVIGIAGIGFGMTGLPQCGQLVALSDNSCLHSGQLIKAMFEKLVYKKH